MPWRRCETCKRSFLQGKGRPARWCPPHRPGGGRWGGEHRKLRAATIGQAYGRACSRCGLVMLYGQELHLDHVDGGGPADYLGWSHATCNESSAATRGNRMRGQRRAAVKAAAASPPPLRTSRQW